MTPPTAWRAEDHARAARVSLRHMPEEGFGNDGCVGQGRETLSDTSGGMSKNSLTSEPRAPSSSCGLKTHLSSVRLRSSDASVAQQGVQPQEGFLRVHGARRAKWNVLLQVEVYLTTGLFNTHHLSSAAPSATTVLPGCISAVSGKDVLPGTPNANSSLRVRPYRDTRVATPVVERA